MWEIEKICIYPVKGLAGISLTACKAEIEGFQFDRKWLIVDEDNLFVSQRKFSIMATIKTQINEGMLILSHEGDEIEISLEPPKIEETFPVTIWQHTVDAFEWSKEASLWLSDKLGRNVKMVSRAPDAYRIKEIPSISKSVSLSFADGYPYLILGTESVNALNQKLAIPIDGNRFRANILVKTKWPHQEDDWKKIKINNTEMQVIKPCVRCQVITIDQDSGVQGKEPTKTLSTYRKEGNGIIFGANVICNIEGMISVGDVISTVNER